MLTYCTCLFVYSTAYYIYVAENGDTPKNYKKNAKEYLKERFMECNEQEAKDLYIHVTCATDSKNVEHVFNACTDVILKQNLKGSGFLD